VARFKKRNFKNQKKVLKRLADGYKSAAIQTARAFKKGTI